MPAMPKSAKALENGLHILVALEVKTTNGQFGPQEEILCLVEGTNDELTRVWVPHNSSKKIEAAEKAKLVRVSDDRSSWEVVTGARFQVFIASGKIMAVTEAPVPTPVNGSQQS